MPLLIAATTLAWMACGLLMATLGLALGVLADPAHRGRLFAWMALAVPAGGLVGGLAFRTLVPEQIAQAAALDALLALPAIPWLGALSDRVERGMGVSLCCRVGAAGLLLLAQATALWEFALASGLMSISTAAGTPLMLALAADLVSPAARNWVLSLCTTAIWLAGIVGFAAAGRLIDGWGAGPLATGASVLALLTALLPLIVALRRRSTKPVAAAAAT